MGEFSVWLDVEEWGLKQQHSSQQSSVNTDTESGQSEGGAAHKIRELGEMPMLIIVALGRPRQKEWYKFKVCLSYTVRSTSAWVT